MSLGYRIFFVHDEDVQKISQKQFNSLYPRKSTALPEYAGKTVLSVLVVLELVARKPDCVIRMDTHKIRFDVEGFIDEAYENEGMQLAASKLDGLFGDLNIRNVEKTSSLKLKTRNSVIEAGKRFDDRRWAQRHPRLSGPVLKKILNSVFGPSA